jgi:hypothetical protein
MPTIEIELSDGTRAVWFVNDEAADGACDLLTEKFGQPDSIKC